MKGHVYFGIQLVVGGSNSLIIAPTLFTIFDYKS